MHASDGRDISIGYAWRASMMANSARDPYWHAAVRREVTDHPSAQAAIEDKCSTCHMPMARFSAAQAGHAGTVFDNIFDVNEPANEWAVDGVSCTVCHQIRDEGFGAESSFDGGFMIDATIEPEQRAVYGPHSIDLGRQKLMQSAGLFLPTEASHLRESELCATCHTLFTQALDSGGSPVGRLAEQVPYLEWLNSDYRDSRSCQSCHMPELQKDAPISSVLGQARPSVSQHTFRGANAFMLGILSRYRDELGVNALPQELDAGVRRVREFLESETAAIDIYDVARDRAALAFEVEIRNLAGHKLPTAYPSRRVWLHVTVTGDDGRIVFESGAPRPDGAIVGNDNDVDAAAFEPHYDVITSPEQVQIYESIVVDSSGEITTGLLSGVEYVKDNRLPPAGFDKTLDKADIAVLGAARGDPNFDGGRDRLRFVVAASGSVTIDAELLYQSIGYRWATNIGEYRSPETDRFVRYYRDGADASVIRIASASQKSP